LRRRSGTPCISMRRAWAGRRRSCEHSRRGIGMEPAAAVRGGGGGGGGGGARRRRRRRREEGGVACVACWTQTQTHRRQRCRRCPAVPRGGGGDAAAAADDRRRAGEGGQYCGTRRGRIRSPRAREAAGGGGAIGGELERGALGRSGSAWALGGPKAKL
jgi:hypothetical protein